MTIAHLLLRHAQPIRTLELAGLAEAVSLVAKVSAVVMAVTAVDVGNALSQGAVKVGGAAARGAAWTAKTE